MAAPYGALAITASNFAEVDPSNGLVNVPFPLTPSVRLADQSQSFQVGNTFVAEENFTLE
jgi:hypothetical protein